MASARMLAELRRAEKARKPQRHSPRHRHFFPGCITCLALYKPIQNQIPYFILRSRQKHHEHFCSVIFQFPVSFFLTSYMNNFNWHSEPLNSNTIITANYKNTQNVRRFFQSHFGTNFKMNREFMAWLKTNAGKTLGDAIKAFENKKLP